MPKIFISYRRSDTPSVSGRIYDRLATRFGKENIFKDVDDIPAGVRFADYIQNSLRQCRVELVIIGQRWLNAKTDDGTPRLDDPRDWVRLEIETGFALGLTVIPVLVEGASLPTMASLPESLRDLREIQVLEIHNDPDFGRDMDRLMASVERILAARPKRSGGWFNRPKPVAPPVRSNMQPTLEVALSSGQTTPELARTTPETAAVSPEPFESPQLLASKAASELAPSLSPTPASGTVPASQSYDPSLSLPQGEMNRTYSNKPRGPLSRQYVIAAIGLLVIVSGFVLIRGLGGLGQRPRATATHTAVATNTPMATATSTTANICDTQSWLWSSAGDSPKITCASATLRLQEGSSHGSGVPAIAYSNSDITFASTNFNTATVTISQLPQGVCAGMIVVGTIGQAPSIAFSVFVCANGSWQIYKYNGTTLNSSAPCAGSISPHYPAAWVFFCPTRINSGTTQVRAPITLTVTQTQSTMGFKIGDTSIDSIDISNANISPPQSVGLAVLVPQGVTQSASFQDFGVV
jgi:hypothetical protein